MSLFKNIDIKVLGGNLVETIRLFGDNSLLIILSQQL